MTPTVKHNQLTIQTGAEPSAPPGSQSTLYAGTDGLIYQKTAAGVKSTLSSVLGVDDVNNAFGNRDILKISNGSIISEASNDQRIMVIPRLLRRRFVYGWPASSYGANGATLTETSSGATALQEFKNKHFTRRFTTNTVAANAGGIASATAEWRFQHEPFLSTIIHTGSDISAQRIWVGLFSAAPGNVATLGTTQAIGFAYFSTDGNLSWVTSNGTTTTRTTMVTMTADTSYLLDVWVIGSTAYFRIDDGTVASTTTTLPAATTNLIPYVRVVNTTATSNTLNIGTFYLESA